MNKLDTNKHYNNDAIKEIVRTINEMAEELRMIKELLAGIERLFNVFNYVKEHNEQFKRTIKG